MTFRSFPAVLWLVLAAMPNVATAQTSPRDVASRFLQAWNARQWTDAAKMLDLDQFDRFRQDFLNRARRQGEAPAPTVDEILRRNPGMPRPVAEYQVSQMESQRRQYADPTPYEFARVQSMSALKTLSIDEAAARWLESRDPKWQAQFQYQQAGCQSPTDLDEMPTPTRRLIGVINESETMSYAVFREDRQADGDRDQQTDEGDLSVMVLRQKGNRWVVVPRSDLLPDVGVNVDPSHCR
jgi:hypothetical protein